MKVSKTALIPFCMFLALAWRPTAAAWGLGPLGGANLSSSENGDMDARTLTGWAVGARLQMGMAPFLSLMFNPMLVQTPHFESASPAVDGRGDFVFLEVPVLLNARVDIFNLGLFGFIGPNVQINTDANGNVQPLRPHPGGYGLSASRARWEPDWPLAWPPASISPDARYSHGLTNLLSGAKGDLETWRTRDVRLNVGVLLHTPRMGALFRPGNAFKSQPD